MSISVRKKSQYRILFTLILIAAMIGAGYGALLDISIRSELTAYSFMRGAMRGVFISFIMLAFEISLKRSRIGKYLRQTPFSISLILHTIASTSVLLLAIIISRNLLSSRGHTLEHWLIIGFMRDAVFAAIMIFAIHFILQMRRLVGGRILANFFLGRYHQPVVENRIFMLLDITGSTALAQRLGDTGAHALISRFFFDIAEPIIEYGGEIHRYIGDEVVITWPLDGKNDNARCLLCYFAICDLMAARSDFYISKFGEALEFRAGIHGGPVVAGECGDDKREVVYIGDTINTAKRLQQACSNHDTNMLMSGDLLDAISLPENMRAVNLGSEILRGRSENIQLFTVTREAE